MATCGDRAAAGCLDPAIRRPDAAAQLVPRNPILLPGRAPSTPGRQNDRCAAPPAVARVPGAPELCASGTYVRPQARPRQSGHDPTVSDGEAAQAAAWLREHGWDMRVEERNLRPTFEERGLRYAPTIDDPWWADLVRIGDPSFVVENYGSGRTPEAAIVRAKQRYGSEQT